MPQIIITIVFGFLWWLIFNHVGPGLTYLMILGSVLAVCVCCCKGGEQGGGEWGWWSFSVDPWRLCIARCLWPTLALIIALIIIGILVVLYTTHMFPSGVELTNILLAAIFAPILVRIICCAYE
jgi:hypothetical protein